MDYVDAVEHLCASGAGQGLRDAEELLIGAFIDPGEVLDEFGVELYTLVVLYFNNMIRRFFEVI